MKIKQNLNWIKKIKHKVSKTDKQTDLVTDMGLGYSGWASSIPGIIYPKSGPRATTRPTTHYMRTARDKLLGPRAVFCSSYYWFGFGLGLVWVQLIFSTILSLLCYHYARPMVMSLTLIEFEFGIQLEIISF